MPSARSTRPSSPARRWTLGALFPAAVLLAACCFALRSPAQTLPAIPPTSPAAAPRQAASTSPQAPQRARVDFAAGRLLVTADNSSLNQILRDISRVTGMKITGGVNDERVFGTYGPADTAAVLTGLLNGTGSNMLLVEDSRQSPQELVLTPRHGGPTPPNPNAARDAGGEVDLPPQLTPRLPRQNPPPAQPVPQPPGTQPNGALPEAMPPPADPAAANPSGTAPNPAAGDTTQQSPNGVKTPAQIYDQLMKLQQQQQQKPPQ